MPRILAKKPFLFCYRSSRIFFLHVFPVRNGFVTNSKTRSTFHFLPFAFPFFYRKELIFCRERGGKQTKNSLVFRQLNKYFKCTENTFLMKANMPVNSVQQNWANSVCFHSHLCAFCFSFFSCNLLARTWLTGTRVGSNFGGPAMWPLTRRPGQRSDTHIGSAGTRWWLSAGATGSALPRGAKADERKISRAFIPGPNTPPS